MKLTDQEKAVLDGCEGEARAHAMDLIVRYGKALGAEKLVDTNNVCGGVVGSLPGRRDAIPEHMREDMDAVYSLMNLDSDTRLEIPQLKAMTYKLIDAMDADYADIQRVPEEGRVMTERVSQFCSKIGVNQCSTCTPYQVGVVPVFGEHCAWMESSAVIYINSVIGARSNVEGAHSAAAAALVGKTPYWGYHTPDFRRASHKVVVDFHPETELDWGLLGYFVGEYVKENVPVLTGIQGPPNPNNLKHFGAAAASSGGIEMYHIVGVTPEAPFEEAAFSGRECEDVLTFDKKARDETFGLFSTATDPDVDFIKIGCPHASLEQVQEVARLLDGRKLADGTDLWVFTPRSIKVIAERQGYKKMIEDAGGYLMSDSCAALSKVYPEGVKVAATNSCKQAHYMPAILGFETWLGTTEQCVEAAVTGKWQAAL